jgi:hypothetical protein
VLVIHDTTNFEFSCDAERSGLGWVQHTKGNVTKGFFGHFALALSADNAHLPLGIIGVLAVLSGEYLCAYFRLYFVFR